MSRNVCPRCQRPVTHCLCAAIPCLRSRTRVTVLQHPQESRHPLNTGRLVCIGLQSARFLCGEMFAEATWQEPGTWLLFPGEQAVSIDEVPAGDRPAHIIVPDGTWRMARRLLRLNPALAALPRLVVPAGAPSRYRVRNTREAGAVATIEAVVRTLNALEAPTCFDALLAPFELMVEQQLASMAQAHSQPTGHARRQ